MTKSIYISEELIQKIKEKAKKENRTFSWMLSDIIRQYFQKKESEVEK